ncbi:Outer membrane protein-related peptidoglycan-associated (lipo)protein [Alloalcanivorax dieselolei B5]|uniref:Outer membrane protein-related peptidoglycan-associated (Lipo)protein n=1 Tax=Alcanivorax dieselolei (strain DSM 16502 / CGMCC 1.3690 / MCCC 1A00001 / B-5) TaxID=930169 RepID=K0CFR1_ALCDB|nr:OmpA family protein [Alloalcanivorax dieselolei]AFT70461.1 Outer membrane protein-related peptidoglycan-associated (lipo)protein [Alloalcanivorax dieselolei B5]GGJ84467.1 hypothetical protein GCM10007426_11970 [Alloalcanivorax dieselolei]
MSWRKGVLMLLCGALMQVSFAQEAEEVPEKPALPPVVAKGVVPDQATRAAVLERLHEIYGAERVVDRIQVEAVPAPPNWGQYVANMLSPELKSIRGGEINIEGQSVRITGEVDNEAQRQRVASALSMASSRDYTVTNSLRLGESRQQRLDDTLADRLIRFQSGSDQLTVDGRRILDEMAEVMRDMGDAHVQIIGHTDNVGRRQNNVALSYARADAVRRYLIEQGVREDGLGVVGKGPDEPVADNATPEGRARNRRIEFRIL